MLGLMLMANPISSSANSSTAGTVRNVRLGYKRAASLTERSRRERPSRLFAASSSNAIATRTPSSSAVKVSVSSPWRT